MGASTPATSPWKSRRCLFFSSNKGTSLGGCKVRPHNCSSKLPLYFRCDPTSLMEISSPNAHLVFLQQEDTQEEGKT